MGDDDNLNKQKQNREVDKVPIIGGTDTKFTRKDVAA